MPSSWNRPYNRTSLTGQHAAPAVTPQSANPVTIARPAGSGSTRHGLASAKKQTMPKRAR